MKVGDEVVVMGKIVGSTTGPNGTNWNVRLETSVGTQDRSLHFREEDLETVGCDCAAVNYKPGDRIVMLYDDIMDGYDEGNEFRVVDVDGSAVAFLDNDGDKRWLPYWNVAPARAFDLCDMVVTPENELAIVFGISEDPSDTQPYEVGFVDVGGSDYFAEDELRPYTGDSDISEQGGNPPPAPHPADTTNSMDFVAAWLADIVTRSRTTGKAA